MQVFRSKSRKFPNKAWWERIDSTVGTEQEDLDFWGAVVLFWTGTGYNPMNVVGMLQCFRNGELPGVRGYGKANWREALALFDEGGQAAVGGSKPVHIELTE